MSAHLVLKLLPCGFSVTCSQVNPSLTRTKQKNKCQAAGEQERLGQRGLEAKAPIQRRAWPSGEQGLQAATQNGKEG